MAFKNNNPGCGCGCSGSGGNKIPGCPCLGVPDRVTLTIVYRGNTSNNTSNDLAFTTTKPVYASPMPDAFFRGAGYWSPSLFTSYGYNPNNYRSYLYLVCTNGNYDLFIGTVNTAGSYLPNPANPTTFSPSGTACSPFLLVHDYPGQFGVTYTISGAQS